MDTTQPPDYCYCTTFEAAQETGTDNEGYAALLKPDMGFWKIGCGLPRISFCPWCGSKVCPTPNEKS
jgi:hypothetical protein